MFAMKGGEFDYVQPNLGYGNALAGLGSSLSSAFKGMGAQQAYANRGGQQQAQIAGFGPTGGGGSNGMFTMNEYDSSY